MTVAKAMARALDAAATTSGEPVEEGVSGGGLGGSSSSGSSERGGERDDSDFQRDFSVTSRAPRLYFRRPESVSWIEVALLLRRNAPDSEGTGAPALSEWPASQQRSWEEAIEKALLSGLSEKIQQAK